MTISEKILKSVTTKTCFNCNLDELHYRNLMSLSYGEIKKKHFSECSFMFINVFAISLHSKE